VEEEKGEREGLDPFEIPQSQLDLGKRIWRLKPSMQAMLQVAACQFNLSLPVCLDDASLRMFLRCQDTYQVLPEHQSRGELDPTMEGQSIWCGNLLPIANVISFASTK